MHGQLGPYKIWINVRFGLVVFQGEVAYGGLKLMIRVPREPYRLDRSNERKDHHFFLSTQKAQTHETTWIAILKATTWIAILNAYEDSENLTLLRPLGKRRKVGQGNIS